MVVAMTYHQLVSKIRKDGDRRDACPTCLTALAAQPLTAWIRLKLELQRQVDARFLFDTQRHEMAR